MIREKSVGMYGETIIQLIPENEEDLKLLRKRDGDEELDARHSFADDPERLPLEEQGSGEKPPKRELEPPFRVK